jgi:hypothetical protein
MPQIVQFKLGQGRKVGLFCFDLWKAVEGGGGRRGGGGGEGKKEGRREDRTNGIRKEEIMLR